MLEGEKTLGLKFIPPLFTRVRHRTAWKLRCVARASRSEARRNQSQQVKNILSEKGPRFQIMGWST